ncbi:class II aaRS and biotin synthetase [Russula earlei]|uniref:Class II aaRS and biotin synthetase n=1 Tax=Russula earlei TaxID=71964 RepID=A0ACC0UAZ2_9AGAM|nr:class II aaRS and biotin synthetase [Russula earlei]
MNVLVYVSSASQGLAYALRSILSPFYTVQSITPLSLATQPWTTSCALLVLPPSDSPHAPPSLPRPAHEAIQEYIIAGGRILCIGLGVSVLPHRPAQGRFDLWDVKSGTAIVPEAPKEDLTRSPHSSIFLQTGRLLSALRPAVIRGRWDGARQRGSQEVQISVGSGCAAFWGVSPFLDETEDWAGILALLRYSLTSLGLSVPQEMTPDGSPNPLPVTPRYPLPQFLLHSPGKGYITRAILQGLGLSAPFAAESPSNSKLGVIKDRADTFQFHWASTLEHGMRLIAEARGSTGASSHGAIATDALRMVVVLPPDILPTKEFTPSFDAEKYFAVLAEVRGDQAGSADSWGMGEALFYGEAVTSTQTMLERNPRFLSALPAPIVSLATFQLAGRGRGSNLWLSPPGCLQFSILVRIPLRASAFPTSRLVFVQYLVGLAVVHASRDSRALGIVRGARVRLKWPNDVYIDLPSSAGGEKKKVGGILVNTSFSDGNVDIVIGCGINVCTPAPVTALSSLLSEPGEWLDVETMLALILNEFERLWSAFVSGRGSWVSFEEAYLDAWMHSDQLVTLTTVDPPVPVRIIGITHDHGLLRTIPERTGWSKTMQRGTDEYIDLQPDGNSFDIMMGLIKAKK